MSEVEGQDLLPTFDFDDLPVVPESELDLHDSLKLTIDDLAPFVSGVKNLIDVLGGTAGIAPNGGGEVLYRVVDAAGKAISPDMLQQFKDGSGLLGSVKTADSFAQARLLPIDPQMVSAGSAAIDPVMLFVAAALADVNQKLDAISDMQKEMFAYAKLRDHAELISAFNVLNELRDNYRFNVGNETYIRTRQQLVATARKDAEKAIAVQRGLLTKMLSPMGIVHLTKDVSERTDKMVEALKEYQLASYLYCYSTLMDVMLVGNFEPAYLESVSSKMEKYSWQYFELYGRCADRIEKDARESLGARVAGGFGVAGNILGEFIATTPVGEKTQLDEVLIDGAKAISKMSDNEADRSIKALASAKPGFMRPFINTVEELDRLHNQPVALAVGNGSVYVLPMGEDAAGE